MEQCVGNRNRQGCLTDAQRAKESLSWFTKTAPAGVYARAAKPFNAWMRTGAGYLGEQFAHWRCLTGKRRHVRIEAERASRDQSEETRKP